MNRITTVFINHRYRMGYLRVKMESKDIEKRIDKQITDSLISVGNRLSDNETWLMDIEKGLGETQADIDTTTLLTAKATALTMRDITTLQAVCLKLYSRHNQLRDIVYDLTEIVMRQETRQLALTQQQATTSNRVIANEKVNDINTETILREMQVTNKGINRVTDRVNGIDSRLIETQAIQQSKTEKIKGIQQEINQIKARQDNFADYQQRLFADINDKSKATATLKEIDSKIKKE